MDAQHAGAHHYSLDFFEHLSHQYDYEMLIGELIPRRFHNSGKPYQKPKNDDSVCVAMIKGSGGDFNDEEEFNQLLSFIQLATEGSGMDEQYGQNK